MYGLMSHVIKGLRQRELLNITINFIGSILKAMKTTQKAADDRTIFHEIGF
jgi:hypothetical protein